MRYVSIDIECTGLSEDSNDILEFGAVLDDLNDQKPLDSLPVFHCYFIQDNYVGEPMALSMHPLIFRRIATREQGFTYISPNKFGHSFRRFLVDNGYKEERDKVTINAAGKNFSSFDLQFLKRKTDLLKHVNIRSKVLDPAILYFHPDDLSLPGMETCKSRAGMGDKVMHDAVNDAKDVVILLRNAMNRLFKL